MLTFQAQPRSCSKTKHAAHERIQDAFQRFSDTIRMIRNDCGIVRSSAQQYSLTQLVHVPSQRGAYRRSVMNLVDTTRVAFVSVPRRFVPNARAQAHLKQLTHAR
jgi:non-canonical (house-cleaning) NTP pyrophosphatase